MCWWITQLVHPSGRVLPAVSGVPVIECASVPHGLMSPLQPDGAELMNIPWNHKYVAYRCVSLILECSGDPELWRHAERIHKHRHEQSVQRWDKNIPEEELPWHVSLPGGNWKIGLQEALAREEDLGEPHEPEKGGCTSFYNRADAYVGGHRRKRGPVFGNHFIIDAKPWLFE